jgi:hypothetical protein
MLRNALSTAAAVLVTVPLLAAPAPEGGKGKGRDKVVVIRDDGKKVVFVDDDRHLVRNYWHSTYRNSCPPGLVRVGRSCMTRGHARKRYVVGNYLPRTVVVEAVPKGLLSQLRQPPYGYKYVMVDGDVLLMHTRSWRVSDAIANMFDD